MTFELTAPSVGSGRIRVYTPERARHVTAYVYSLSPNQVEGEFKDTEVRLQFTDNGEIITDDSLAMGEDVVSKTYQMTIYGGGLDQNKIQAVFTAADGATEEFSVAIGTGDLTVKSVADPEYTARLRQSEQAVSDDNIVAVPTGTMSDFYVNDSEVPIDNTGEDANRVKLLVDDVSNNKAL